ncbi:MAG: tRNA (adenosine(37)-N6)-threonylcarbamoyltransferase complex dimerization subunit type 1 TsaB [Bacteroidota bacterium]
MSVLGIETATSVCAAAIAAEETVVAEEGIDQERVHAEKLLVLVDRVLKSAGKQLKDLRGIAISIGPGSFTGLRIGLSVAKGLSFAAGIPLVAVPTLESLARRVIDAAPASQPGRILATIDARRDEVYCQLFRTGSGGCDPVWRARDLSVAELAEELGELDLVLTGDGSAKVLRFLSGMDRPPPVTAAEPGIARCSAATVALMGSRLLVEGKRDDPSSLEPAYVKEFFFASRSSQT